MALVKIPAYRAPINADGIWIVPVSRVLRLGCVVQGCDNPACACMDVTVAAYPLDECVEAFGFRKGKLISQSRALGDRTASGAPPLVLRIDVWTGDVKDKDDRFVDAASDRRAAAIQDALDAEALDALDGVWRRTKGIASRAGIRRHAVRSWDRGELVYWDDVFEVDRQEAFRDEGGVVVAMDMYCIDPARDYREVRVAFSEAVEEGEGEPCALGAVRVTFAGKVEMEPASPELEDRLRALWTRYRRRHPTLRTKVDRYREMRSFGAEYFAGAAPVAAGDVAARAWVPSSKKHRSRERS